MLYMNVEMFGTTLFQMSMVNKSQNGFMSQIMLPIKVNHDILLLSDHFVNIVTQ